MSRFGKFLTGGTGHKQSEDTGDAWEPPKDRGQDHPLDANYLKTAPSGKASLFLVHLGSKTKEMWIPNSLIMNLEHIDWEGTKCEVRVPKWWWAKEGIV